jgi:hypothetical protein
MDLYGQRFVFAQQKFSEQRVWLVEVFKNRNVDKSAGNKGANAFVRVFAARKFCLRSNGNSCPLI